MRKIRILESFFLFLLGITTIIIVSDVAQFDLISFSGRLIRKLNFKKQDEMDTKSIELTIRMTLNNEMINRSMCDLMRSSVMFWDPNYGDVVIILDAEEKTNAKTLADFIKNLKSTLPFSFRVVYEKSPSDPALIEKVAKRNGRPYGYYRMFYSSFLMDLYAKPNSIIAWTDTDVIFTMPVMKETIFRNGRLIVKGANTFNFSWVREWARSTSIALGGLPMIADFMVYYPVYIYPSTIKNCREYILKTLKVDNMELAIEKIGVTIVSPVCILLSYAYFFERDMYDWHIDLAFTSLDVYNKEHSIKNHSLTVNDTHPELHQTIHRRYYYRKGEPLKQGICFTYLKIGRRNYPLSCKEFQGKINWQLFEFQSQFTHINTWCNGNNKEHCINLIDNSYKTFQKEYENKSMYRNISLIGLVENLYFRTTGNKCSDLGL